MCVCNIYIYIQYIYHIALHYSIIDAEQLVTSPDISWHPARVTFQRRQGHSQKHPPYTKIPKWSQHRSHHTIAGFWLASSWSGFFWPAATFSNGPKTWSCLKFFGQLDETPYDQQWHLRSRCVGSMSVFCHRFAVNTKPPLLLVKPTDLNWNQSC